MSIYDGYDFKVEAVHPSGLVSYQSGHVKASRKFLVPCQHAEEFALRLLGKFMEEDSEPHSELPAPFPFGVSRYSRVDAFGQLNMVATSFSIEPICPQCFNVSYLDTEEQVSNVITNPTQWKQFEKYWLDDSDSDESNSLQDCKCYVNIDYEENPCDCITFSTEDGEWVAHAEILHGTCISVERNPSYEMFTLPNGNLIWVGDNVGSDPRLKSDSYAYKVIPKADIIVSWHNVPVNQLCKIETHLAQYRGTVNEDYWGDLLFCDYTAESASDDACDQYEPETILFIDWQEDRSKRTDAFGGMNPDFPIANRNTTTLKLIFKQKRNVNPANTSNSASDDDVEQVVGWNHLWLDRETGSDTWTRVHVKSTDLDIFPLVDFTNILNPTL